MKKVANEISVRNLGGGEMNTLGVMEYGKKDKKAERKRKEIERTVSKNYFA